MGLGSGIRDLGFGIRKKPIPDPGSRGQKGTRSRIRNTGIHMFLGLPDPDPLVRGRNPDPDPSIVMLK